MTVNQTRRQVDPIASTAIPQVADAARIPPKKVVARGHMRNHRPLIPTS